MDQAMKKSDLWLQAKVPEILNLCSFSGIGKVIAWIYFIGKNTE